MAEDEMFKVVRSGKRKSKSYIPCGAGFTTLVDNNLHGLMIYGINCWLMQYAKNGVKIFPLAVANLLFSSLV